MGLPPPPPPPPPRAGNLHAHVRALERELASARAREQQAEAALAAAASCVCEWMQLSTDMLDSLAVRAGGAASVAELRGCVADEARVLPLAVAATQSRLQSVGVALVAPTAPPPTAATDNSRHALEGAIAPAALHAAAGAPTLLHSGAVASSLGRTLASSADMARLAQSLEEAARHISGLMGTAAARGLGPGVVDPHQLGEDSGAGSSVSAQPPTVRVFGSQHREDPPRAAGRQQGGAPVDALSPASPAAVAIADSALAAAQAAAAAATLSASEAQWQLASSQQECTRLAGQLRDCLQQQQQQQQPTPSEVARLRAAAEAAESASELAQADVTLLRQRLAASEAQAGWLQAQLGASQRERLHVGEELEAAHAKNAALSREMVQLREEVRAVAEAVAATEERAAASQQRVDAAVNTSDSAAVGVAGTAHDWAALVDAHAAAAVEADAQRRRASSLQGALDATAAELQAAARLAASLRDEAASARASRVVAEGLQSQLDAAHDELARLQSQHVRTQIEREAAVRAALADAERRHQAALATQTASSSLAISELERQLQHATASARAQHEVVADRAGAAWVHVEALEEGVGAAADADGGNQSSSGDAVRLVDEVARLGACESRLQAALDDTRYRLQEAELQRDGAHTQVAGALHDLAAALSGMFRVAVPPAALLDGGWRQLLPATVAEPPVQQQLQPQQPQQQQQGDGRVMATELEAAAVHLRALDLQKGSLAKQLAQAHQDARLLGAQLTVARSELRQLRAAAAPALPSSAGAAQPAAAATGCEPLQRAGASDAAIDARSLVSHVHWQAAAASLPAATARQREPPRSRSGSSGSGSSGSGGPLHAPPALVQLTSSLSATASGAPDRDVGSIDGEWRLHAEPAVVAATPARSMGEPALPPRLGSAPVPASPLGAAAVSTAAVVLPSPQRAFDDGSRPPRSPAQDALAAAASSAAAAAPPLLTRAARLPATQLLLPLADRRLRTAPPVGGRGGAGPLLDAGVAAAAVDSSTALPPNDDVGFIHAATSSATAAPHLLGSSTRVLARAGLPAYSRPPAAAGGGAGAWPHADFSPAPARMLASSSELSRPPALGGAGERRALSSAVAVQLHPGPSGPARPANGARGHAAPRRLSMASIATLH